MRRLALLRRALHEIAVEPPFRLLARELVRIAPGAVRTKATFGAVARPAYLAGTLWAADEARSEGLQAISVLELGVAGGTGLLALQEYAAAVEAETGVQIRVYGFDMGTGLPTLLDDHRDHPDVFRPGDYPMEGHQLSGRLSERTQLILGNVAESIPRFVEEGDAPPVGFVSVDLDLYSSTKAALNGLLATPLRRCLRKLPMYFDDTVDDVNHRFAGELLAIEEFNAENEGVKIDEWAAMAARRPFPEAVWRRRMYLAHDLEAIARVSEERRPRRLDLPSVAR